MGLSTAAVVGIVSAVASAAGTGVAIASSIQQSRAQEKAAKFNAEVARADAEAQARAAAFERDRAKDRRRRILGKQKARFAKAGLRVDTGTPAAVALDSEIQAELNELAILNTGRSRAQSLETQADLLGTTAGNIRSGRVIGAVGTGLQGAAQTAGAFSFLESRRNPGAG